MTAVREFAIDVPRPTLDDAGTDPDYLAAFMSSWADFDWRRTEREVNRLPPRLVEASGADIHVLHVRGRAEPRQMPLPLVLTHGWPSSFFEFLALIGPLTDAAAHGGDAADAFDVVIPSLPGFGFSTPLPRGPTEPSRIPAVWVEVMDALGCTVFGAYGGDIGSHVTNFLGADHPERVVGVFTRHLNLHPVIDPDRPLSPTEQRYLEERSNDLGGHDDGYAAIQTTRARRPPPGARTTRAPRP